MAETPLQIKKYPNRRFYDATNSRHVTLSDLRDAVLAGEEIRVTDSRNGDDLTNAILTQIILEKDPLKLSVFPAPILHQIIRTQHQHLGGVFEQWMRQSIEAQRSTQEQFARFLQNTLGGGANDWTRSWFDALTPHWPTPRSASVEAQAGEAPGHETDAEAAQSELSDLRRKLAELTRQVAELADAREE